MCSFHFGINSWQVSLMNYNLFMEVSWTTQLSNFKFSPLSFALPIFFLKKHVLEGAQQGLKYRTRLS